MSKAVWPRPYNNPTQRPFLTGGSVSAQVATVNTGVGWWPTAVPPLTAGYQWYRGTASVANATSASYLISSTDRGSTIFCTVSGTNKYGAAAAGVAAGFTIA
jgi:hypothetical protein